MEILLFRSLETDVCDQWLLPKTASNRIKEKQKNTERKLQSSEECVISSLKKNTTFLGKARKYIELTWKPTSCCGSAAHTLLQHSLSARPQGRAGGSQHPASQVNLREKVHHGCWAVNLSWTGKCLFLQLLTTWDHQGRKSASLSTACCSLPLTPTLPRPQGCGDHSSSKQHTKEHSLGCPFCQHKHLILAKAGGCWSWGRGRLLSAIPQLTHSCWTGASLNNPVMANTGLCPITRLIYWQGRVCFCKGCAQAVAGWKANNHLPEKVWWTKWTER